MLRIHFTAEDLLGVRFADGPAPLVELGLAVAMLQRHDGGPGFARWRRSLSTPRTRAAVAPLRQLVPPDGAGPLFLDPPSDDLDQGLEAVRGSTTTLVHRELTRVTTKGGLPATTLLRRLADQDRDAWRYLERAVRAAYPDLVGTAWPRLRTGFDTDLAWRARVQREHGLRGMLAGLHPGSRWRGSVLEIPAEREVDVRPGGAGLVLMPSAQWTGGPLAGPYPLGTLLVYPAVTPLPLLAGPAPHGRAQDGREAQDDPIAALLGRTRAAVLRLADREPTTSQLAAELGISLASASEHARALRRAGLVTTVRSGRAVRHSRTGLGHRLLSP
ncbi:winged helix-turn-helix domain-containing protein [Streptomyces sp. SP17BM10]|uniref:ArsR/SmtB family transcription factor n=1 Tax=Streptomyces sp. SP17BM10 TaxID=3002530 RepID=UPI002E78BB7E|nr:winged helix-turn-helix domain-containing protein [Streptomyces sp. SP17BM10]MEE1788618.1 winged helix-turn-helix domain-containing protein [Streptomyces sp. SP17BM10]